MNSVFITGTITAGKSHLANKLSASLPIQHISTDELWESVKDHPEFKSWYNYFWNKDEAEYYRTTSSEQLWQDIVNQSEAIWPIVKRASRRCQTRAGQRSSRASAFYLISCTKFP